MTIVNYDTPSLLLSLANFANVALTPREALLAYLVELAGVEPASKQGNHTLSTRLFWPSVFERQQDPDHQLSPYPLNLHQRLEAATGYFRLDLHRLIRMVRKKSS